MNYSTVIFLTNKHVRAMVAIYEAEPEEHRKNPNNRTTFKTLDKDLKIGDFIIVPTKTRHNMTVMKIVEADVDVDLDTTTQIDWIIGKIDRKEYEETITNEAAIISAVKSAEIRSKRENLAHALFKDNLTTLKALPMVAINGDTPAEPKVA